MTLTVAVRILFFFSGNEDVMKFYVLIFIERYE